MEGPRRSTSLVTHTTDRETEGHIHRNQRACFSLGFLFSSLNQQRYSLWKRWGEGVGLLQPHSPLGSPSLGLRLRLGWRDGSGRAELPECPTLPQADPLQHLPIFLGAQALPRLRESVPRTRERESGEMGWRQDSSSLWDHSLPLPSRGERAIAYGRFTLIHFNSPSIY